MTIERRNGWITASGVILLASGILAGLIGLVIVIFGIAMGGMFGDMIREQQAQLPSNVSPESFGRMMLFIMGGVGLVGLVWAGLQIGAGIGVLGLRSWARILGIVTSAIGAVFGLLGLIAIVFSAIAILGAVDDPRFEELYGPGASVGTMQAGLFINVLFILPFLIGYMVVLVALIRNGDAFRRTQTAEGS